MLELIEHYCSVWKESWNPSTKIGCPAKMSWFYERLISPLTYQVYLLQVGMSEKWGIDLPLYCHSRLARCSVQTFRIVDPGPKISGCQTDQIHPAAFSVMLLTGMRPSSKTLLTHICDMTMWRFFT